MQKYDKSGILFIKVWINVISANFFVKNRFFSYIDYKNSNDHNLLLTYESIIMFCSFSLKIWFAYSKTPF